MLTMYEIYELAIQHGIDEREILLCAYIDGLELSVVAEELAAVILTRSVRAGC